MIHWWFVVYLLYVIGLTPQLRPRAGALAAPLGSPSRPPAPAPGPQPRKTAHRHIG